ncbi:hypothetical protein ACSSS7_006322 [Eimeria intestinalis]
MGSELKSPGRRGAPPSELGGPPSHTFHKSSISCSSSSGSSGSSSSSSSSRETPASNKPQDRQHQHQRLILKHTFSFLCRRGREHTPEGRCSSSSNSSSSGSKLRRLHVLIGLLLLHLLPSIAGSSSSSSNKNNNSYLGAAAGPVGSLSGETVSEGGSADSLFIRDIHERRELKRQEIEGGGDSESGNEGGGGFLHDLLKHFRHCCASRRKGRFAPTAASAAASAPGNAATGLAAAAASAVKGRPHRARTYSASGSSSSSSSSSSSTDARTAVADQYIPDKAHLISWRVVLGQRGPAGARWVGEEEGYGGVGGGPLGAAFYNITPSQAAWAACRWCVRLENNEKMTGRLIEELVEEGFAQKAAVDVLHAVKETTQFGALGFVRRVDGVEAEDVLGDFNGLYDREVRPDTQATAGAAVYAVLQAARVVGLFVRRHGELIECSAFNVNPIEKERFPPSVIGFNTIEDMEEYVLELYKRDPRMKRVGGGVSALLFKSRSLHKIAPGRSDYTAARERDTEKENGDSALQKRRRRSGDRHAHKERGGRGHPAKGRWAAVVRPRQLIRGGGIGRSTAGALVVVLLVGGCREQGVGMEIREFEDLQHTQKFMSPDEAVSVQINRCCFRVYRELKGGCFRVYRQPSRL